jgi:LPXTG-motif cell wall-anchored protein
MPLRSAIVTERLRLGTGGVRWFESRRGKRRRERMFARSRKFRSMTVLTITALGMLLMSVAPASAQYPPAEPPGLRCPPSATPGGVTPPGLVRACRLLGTQANQAFQVRYEYNPTVEVGVVTTNDEGVAEFELTLQRDTVGRVVTVIAVGEDGEELVTVDDSFRVAGAAEPPVDRGQPVTPGRGIPRTGTDALLLVGVGVLLVGAGTVAVRRRRADDRTHAEV